MAPPSPSAEDVETSPQTRCATCATVFEVSAELLGSSDTRVRCGECYRIFDALDNLVRPVGGVGGGGPAGGGGGRGGAREPGAARGGAGTVAVFPRGRAANSGADGGALDSTYADFDLFSEDADLPDVAYFDRTSETPEFDFDSVELETDETFNDTLFAHDVTIDPGELGARPAAGFAAPPAAVELEVIEPASPREPLTFVYRDAEAGFDDAPSDGVPDGVPDGAPGGAPDAPPANGTGAGAGAGDSGDWSEDVPGDGPEDGPGDGPRAAAPVHPVLAPEDVRPFGPPEPAPRRRRWPAAAMLLALGLLLAGLHAWRVRDAPENDPFVRPAYVAACRVLGCEVPPRVALDRLALVRRAMYEHPDIDDALVIDVSFRNDAPFAQRYPTLVVRLSDPSGRLVARRAFLASEYLAPDAAPALAPGARLDIDLEVSDPGEDASSFEIEFHAP